MYLNDIWSFYFHDPYNIDWNTNSFKFICNISNVDDFIKLYLTYKDIIFKGMFFIMREHILPIWEDENNINGGCFSLKIYKENIHEKLFELSSLLLGEKLGKTDEISNNINGISISPKKNYFIIRIWIKDNRYAIKQNYNIEIAKYTTVLYKNHVV
tara:strand:+ start:7153 stop:7620 length:468 start_codon:yes stop_codon:yes gene_type:complete